MKWTMTALAASLLLAFPAYADEGHEHQAAAAAPAAQGASVKKMQENARKMQSQLDRIGKAKSDEERRQLMAEHLRTLRENMMLGMAMAKDGMGCPMHEGGMMGGGMGMMGGKGMMGQGMGQGMMGEGPEHEAMMGRMQQLEKRLDMMQMMMEQMAKPQAAPAK